MALAENSKPFRPFLVMVENVKIDSIRELPVSLTHLLHRSSSLPSSLVGQAGFCSARAARLLQHRYYFPPPYYRNTAAAQGGLRVLAIHVVVIAVVVIL